MLITNTVTKTTDFVGRKGDLTKSVNLLWLEPAEEVLCIVYESETEKTDQRIGPCGLINRGIKCAAERTSVRASHARHPVSNEAQHTPLMKQRWQRLRTITSFLYLRNISYFSRSLLTLWNFKKPCDMVKIGGEYFDNHIFMWTANYKRFFPSNYVVLSRLH
jgi:hypothetical protein